MNTYFYNNNNNYIVVNDNIKDNCKGKYIGINSNNKLIIVDSNNYNYSHNSYNKKIYTMSNTCISCCGISANINTYGWSDPITKYYSDFSNIPILGYGIFVSKQNYLNDISNGINKLINQGINIIKKPIIILYLDNSGFVDKQQLFEGISNEIILKNLTYSNQNSINLAHNLTQFYNKTTTTDTFELSNGVLISIIDFNNNVSPVFHLQWYLHESSCDVSLNKNLTPNNNVALWCPPNDMYRMPNNTSSTGTQTRRIISFSYLRKDLSYQTNKQNNVFMIYDNSNNTNLIDSSRILCSYPLDGMTDTFADEFGCIDGYIGCYKAINNFKNFISQTKMENEKNVFMNEVIIRSWNYDINGPYYLEKYNPSPSTCTHKWQICNSNKPPCCSNLICKANQCQ